MNQAIRHTTFLSVSVLLSALLLSVSIFYVSLARSYESTRRQDMAERQALMEYREWSQYLGVQKGADMIDFIIRHKESVPIEIECSLWPSELLPLLADRRLRLGPGSVREMPDTVWDKTFLYHVLLQGRGDTPCLAEGILQNGEIIGIRYYL